MSNDYERMLREYNVPAGVLTNEELRMLQQGGIRLDDSDGEEDYYPPPHSHQQPLDRTTQPRLPRVAPQPAFEQESLRTIYEEQLAMKDKQLAFLQADAAQRDRVVEA
jgi:hypothetical protein